VFTCIAVDWILITLLSTPPRDDAVALEFSTFFMVSVVPGLPPGGVVLLDGARVRQLAAAMGGFGLPNEAVDDGRTADRPPSPADSGVSVARFAVAEQAPLGGAAATGRNKPKPEISTQTKSLRQMAGQTQIGIPPTTRSTQGGNFTNFTITSASSLKYYAILAPRSDFRLTAA